MSLPVVTGDFWGAPVSSQPQRVLLICPPYQTTSLSSLAVAQLGTVVRHAGVACDELYLHLALAKHLGNECYRSISSGKHGLLGEMLFAESLHPNQLGDYAAKLHELLGGESRRRELRAELEARVVDTVNRSRPTLVGVTTSCNQTLPALWLSRLLKRHFPELCVVLGGSACAEPMGRRLLDAYPDVDYIVSGYGEAPLVALARGGRPHQRLIASYQPPELSELPIVDYSAFLEQLESFGSERVWLCFESSRGCWWGEKNHCTFCGLNGAEMSFFAKSSERIVREVRTLWKRHGKDLFATDTIMPRRHLTEVLPELAAHHERPRLFYEVKVNMSAREVETLSRANVRAIQPGIESLSTRHLRLMKKGVTTIQNLALMKYCREQRIAVGWNLLCGIPGERPEDYEEQLRLMEKIPQLPPPEMVNPIRVDRYSPYFKAFAEHGWQALEPLAEYRSLHPQLSDSELAELAYHFRGVGGVSSETYLERLNAAVERWQRRFRNEEGLYCHPTNGLVVNHEQGARRLAGGELVSRIIACTHEIALEAKVLAHVGCDAGVLESLAQQGLLYREQGKVLNLAIRVGVSAG